MIALNEATDEIENLKFIKMNITINIVKETESQRRKNGTFYWSGSWRPRVTDN